MVQMFNPQALSDPGFGAAASLLGNNIGTFAGMLNQKSNNKNALLQALLGQVGGAGREFLQNRMEGDQGRNALNAALGEELPNDMRISPASANTIIQAVSTPSQLRALNLISGASKDLATAGVPGSDLGFNAVSQGLNRIIGGQGQPTGSSGGQGGGILGKYLGSSQPVAQPQIPQEPTPIQTGEQSFKLGASTGGIAPDSNLITRKQQAETNKAELEAKEKGITIKPVIVKSNTYDRLSELNQAPEGSPVVDIYTGQPFKSLVKGPRAGNMIAQATQEYGDDTKAFNTRRIASIKDGQTSLDLLSQANEMVKGIEPGLAAQVSRNLKGDLVIDITGDAPAAKLRQLSKTFSAKANGIVRQLGDVGAITEGDRAIVLGLLPELLGGGTRANIAYDQMLKVLIPPTATTAVSTLDQSTYDRLNEQWQSRFGVPFDFENQNAVQGQNRPAQKITPMRSESIVPRGMSGGSKTKPQSSQGSDLMDWLMKQ